MFPPAPANNIIVFVCLHRLRQITLRHFLKLYCLHCLQLMTLRYLLRLSCLHSLLLMSLRYLIRLNCLQRWISDITPFVKAKMFASSTRNDNVLFAHAKLFNRLQQMTFRYLQAKLFVLSSTNNITLFTKNKLFLPSSVNDITSSTKERHCAICSS